ncbi:MAG TPA: 3,4-dihydroxy-2-butanone-4-phosphate synthase [Sutterella sp.]|nr:3,4-dihydroxy-2-butanone-4-phosphate synthase [Sutterella sp.]
MGENQLLEVFGKTPEIRVQKALEAFRAGNGVIVVDDANRENEGDIIFPAETISVEQMAFLIRYCSGIVCLAMTHEACVALDLPQQVATNTNTQQTAFCVTIEAARGVTTGVSAADRVATIKAACSPLAKPTDLRRPGHVYPIEARAGGVLTRRGHTESSVDLARLAGFRPMGVLCEIMSEDHFGEMARLPEVVPFAERFEFPLLSVEDICVYRRANNL